MKSLTLRTDRDFDAAEIGARSGMLWRGPNLTVAGVGEGLRIPVDRARRGTGAVEAQQAVSALAGPDHVDQPGSGPVAFGAFPFDPNQAGELVVPEVVLVEGHGQGRWVTVFGAEPLSVDEGLDAALAVEAPQPAPPCKLTLSAPISPSYWRDSIVAGARDRIRAGELTKAVLARELEVSADEPIDQAAVLRVLLARHPAATVFALDGFVGASPELLVARSGDEVRAHPLAGTASRAADPMVDQSRSADLMASAKDRWEHRITIDWLLNELLPFCSYVDAEPEPGVVSLPNVHHLGTRVEGRLSAPPASVLELVAALHPTPAVGGDPQQSALELIAELEGADRGRYAGPTGWVDGRGNGAFCVAIRSAQIAGPNVTLFAGVGVVADSDPDQELAETRAKFEAMLPALMRM